MRRKKLMGRKKLIRRMIERGLVLVVVLAPTLATGIEAMMNGMVETEIDFVVGIVLIPEMDIETEVGIEEIEWIETDIGAGIGIEVDVLALLRIIAKDVAVMVVMISVVIAIDMMTTMTEREVASIKVTGSPDQMKEVVVHMVLPRRYLEINRDITMTVAKLPDVDRMNPSKNGACVVVIISIMRYLRGNALPVRLLLRIWQRLTKMLV